MKNWFKLKGNKFLFWLAVASLVIATLEGVLFYAPVEDMTFRIMLTVQNSIKAFAFNASIGLRDAMDFMGEDPTPFKTLVGYAYAVAVFVAPYCSVAFLYKMLERALKLAGLFRRDRKSGGIIVFGYNDAVRALLEHKSGREKDYRRRTHLVWDGEIPDEERYRLLKEGVTLHRFDLLKIGAGELEGRLKQIGLDKAQYLFLFEDSSIQNFSLLQTLNRDGNRLGEGTKVFCRCEDEGIYRVIESYYDTPQPDNSRHRPFDLEIVDVPQLQIRKMYEERSLHSYYADREAPPPLQKWTTHLLILGFGRLGQQALLQAMNMGVVHSGNGILVDVVDLNVEDKRDVFLSRFSPAAFLEKDGAGEGEFTLNPEWADGSLRIRFHRMDVRYRRFRQLLDEMPGEGKDRIPYTYVVVAMDQPDITIHCVNELQRHLSVWEKENGGRVPILLRMDSDRRLQNYVNGGEDVPGFRGARMIGSPAELLSFTNLLDTETDGLAKRCNYHYASMTFARLARQGDGSAKSAVPVSDPETAWQALTLFKRNANRAAAYHNRVLDRVIPVLAQEGGTTESELMARAFTGPEALVTWDESGQWDYTLTDGEFLARTGRQPLALEMLMTEHRRWCCYTVSIGWARGQKETVAPNGSVKAGNDPELRLNPCLVTWDTLTKERPDMCKYDLMPLMEQAEEAFKKTD